MVTGLPAEAVDLLDEAARALYLTVMAEGGRLPTGSVPTADEQALRQLVETGLVVRSESDGAYVAMSPREVGERISAELCSSAARLLLRAEGLPTALRGLSRAYDSVPRPAFAPEQPAYIDGVVSIRQRLAELLSECGRELITAQPGPRPPEGLLMARRQDTALRRRGIRVRTLYQPQVLGERATVDHATAMTEEGAELRILDESFRRVMIIDRQTAVVSASDDCTRAAFVSDPATVAFLVAVYERDWERAEKVDWARLGAESPMDLAAERIGRLLANGLTQRAVGNRLGLSERTVAGHIARLRERYAARTLFQLGWQMRGRCSGD